MQTDHLPSYHPRAKRHWVTVILGLVLEGILLVPLLVWIAPGLHLQLPLAGLIGECNPSTPTHPLYPEANKNNGFSFSHTLLQLSACHQNVGTVTISPLDLGLAGLLAAIFAITGILIFLRSQDRSTARVAYGLFMSTSLLCCFYPLIDYNIPWIHLMLVNLSTAINGLGTSFVFLFPHTDNYQPNQTRASRLAYLPLYLGGILILSNMLYVFYALPLFSQFTVLIVAYNLSCLIIVIWTLIWGIRTLGKNDRQLASIVMIGTIFLLIASGFTSLGILHIGSAPLPAFPTPQESLWHLIPLPLMILPIICDYAFFRHQLIGTTSLFSRNALRIFLWLILACIFLIPAILLQNIDSILPGIQVYIYAILLVLSLWLFPIIWNKMRDVGDSVIYHDFYQYNGELQQLSTALTTMSGLDQVGDLILPKLAQLLNATETALFIRATSQDEMRYSSNENTHSWHIYHHIAGPNGLSAAKLRQYADKALAQTKKTHTHEPVQINHVLLTALYDREQVSGFLCLGAKKNKEPYSRQDQSFLSTLAGQLSVVEGNNRYLEQARADAQQLTALTHRVISAQEEERMHLALDLHDDVLQEAMLLVRQLSDASTMSDVGDAMPLARSVVTNLRRTCLALRPSLLEELGLAEALQWLARQTEQMNNHKLQVCVCSSGTHMERLSEQIELGFYRIAQEALANVSKHSKATQVTIRLKHNTAMISLLIMDNGQGFHISDRRQENLGIAGMHERMGAIGGNVHLHTIPGRGTIVWATYRIPIQSVEIHQTSNEANTFKEDTYTQQKSRLEGSIK